MIDGSFVRINSRSFDRHGFAVTAWNANDVLDLNSSLSYAEAEHWLAENEADLRQLILIHGPDILARAMFITGMLSRSKLYEIKVGTMHLAHDHENSMSLRHQERVMNTIQIEDVDAG
jgi:hypothetical protein